MIDISFLTAKNEDGKSLLTSQEKLLLLFIKIYPDKLWQKMVIEKTGESERGCRLSLSTLLDFDLIKKEKNKFGVEIYIDTGKDCPSTAVPTAEILPQVNFNINKIKLNER